MGTTLVGCVVSGENLYAVNVGDSRLYVVDREGGIRQVSHDHSYVQYLVDMGKMTPEEAKTSKNKNLITRAVGTERKVEIDTFAETVAAGDVAVLCSDGLSNLVEPGEIAEIARRSAEAGDMQAAAEELIRLANDRGGLDNITAVLLAL